METMPETDPAAIVMRRADTDRLERVDGHALRAAVDREIAAARRIDALIRHRLGRYHSVCVDCSD